MKEQAKNPEQKTRPRRIISNTYRRFKILDRAKRTRKLIY